jgi:hypothetical protein
MKAAHLQQFDSQRSYVYIAGPYSGRDAHGHHGYMTIEQNILNARAAMKELVTRGYGVFCPHTHSAHFEIITPDVGIDYWYELDLYFLKWCHALLRLEGPSTGADKEVEVCHELGIPVFFDLEVLYIQLPIFHSIVPEEAPISVDLVLHID